MKIVLIGLICIVWVQKASSAPKLSSSTPGHSTDHHGLNTDNDLLIMNVDNGSGQYPDYDETRPLEDDDFASTDWEGSCFDGNKTIWEDDFTDHGFRSEGPIPSKNTDVCPSLMKTANRIIVVAGLACLLKVLYISRKKQLKLAKNRSKTPGKSVPKDKPREIVLPVSGIFQPKLTQGPAEGDIQPDEYFSQGLPHSSQDSTDVPQDISIEPFGLEKTPQIAVSEAESVNNDELRSSPGCFIEDTEEVSPLFPSLDLGFDFEFGVFPSESEELYGFAEVEFEELELESFSWEGVEQNAEVSSNPSAMAAFLYSDLVIKGALESEEIPVLDKAEAEKPGDTKSSRKNTCQVISEPELLDWEEISRQMAAENDTEDDPEIITILDCMEEADEVSSFLSPKSVLGTIAPEFEKSSDWENQLTSELVRERELNRNSAMSAPLYSNLPINEAVESKRTCQVISPSLHQPESCPFMEPLNWNDISRQMTADNDMTDDPEIMSILNCKEDVSEVSTPLQQTPYPEFVGSLDWENQSPSDATPQLMKADETGQVKPNTPLDINTMKTRRPDMMDKLRLKDRLRSSSLQDKTGHRFTRVEIDQHPSDIIRRLMPMTEGVDVPSHSLLNWTPGVRNSQCISAKESHLDQMSLEEQRKTRIFGRKASGTKKVSFSDEVTVKTIFLRRSCTFVPKRFRKRVDIRMIEDIHPLKGDTEEKPFKLLKRSKKIISLLRF